MAWCGPTKPTADQIAALNLARDLVAIAAPAIVLREWPEGLVRTITPATGDGTIKLLMQPGHDHRRKPPL